MDFEFAAEHEGLRKEFRDWLAKNLPADLCLDDASDDRVASDRETFERRRAWQRVMHAAGWVGITWPREYGGRDAGIIERIIWDEEYTAARAPGSTTPSTGTGSASRNAGRATADAVLHATTSRSTWRATRKRALRSEYCVTTSGDFVPYGTRAVSPR